MWSKSPWYSIGGGGVPLNHRPTTTWSGSSINVLVFNARHWKYKFSNAQLHSRHDWPSPATYRRMTETSFCFKLWQTFLLDSSVTVAVRDEVGPLHKLLYHTPKILSWHWLPRHKRLQNRVPANISNSGARERCQTILGALHLVPSRSGPL